MKKFFCLSLLFSSFLSWSQPNESDELAFTLASEWLNKKLNYIYHDGAAQKWWVNRFTINDKKEVTIKNILTANPRSASIQEKTFHTRTFKVEDINPYLLNIREIEKNQGRVVKGKLLELKTYGNRKSVHHRINNLRGTDVSFVQISFPSFMLDSISDYAETVQLKFREAIIAATKVYATEDFESNKSKLFEILDGSFESEDGSSLQIVRRFDNVLAIKEENSDNFLYFNPSNNQFEFTSVTSDGVASSNYQLIDEERITLKNTQSEDTITIETISSFWFAGRLYYRI